ncbi:hypothetical protein [Pseudogemmobacter faecipullorum]|uniref:Septation ring formation regulator EzrA n=1 Tax=Pseudogemmobacter faecipullorum TaxID=2755041 RepID=A0ABS8CQS1_9RHOB|nr:hypothetical protein [Pseudogemmobacter faecipullorum]MCB5411736.1 hypothetical protein [Pseudogemmobacter faecipullorum]
MNPREIRHDIFATRAVHDAEFRELLNQYGIATDGGQQALKDRLATLDSREFSELLQHVEKADLNNPRVNNTQQVLYQLNDMSQNLWTSKKAELNREAKKIMEGPVAQARELLQKGDLDAFRDRKEEIIESVQEFSAKIRNARHEVGDQLRQFLYTAKVDIPKADRKSLIDEKMLDHNIPPNMQQVLALENTLSQEEVEYVMRKQSPEQRPSARPMPSPSM